MNSFLQIISTFIYLFPPFITFSCLPTTLFDYTIQVGLPTLEPACERGQLLALKIAIFGQLCLFPISKIHNNVLSLWLILTTIRYDGDWAAFAVHCNVCHGKWKRMDGSRKTTICRICEQPEHSVQVFMK